MKFHKIIGILILVGCAQTSTPAQSLVSKSATPEPILNRRVARCFTMAKSIGVDDCLLIGSVSVNDLLLEALSLQVRPIPFGLVALANGDQPSLNFTPRGLTVRDVLNSVIETDRRYRWSLESGVVNLLPTKGTPPLLDVCLNHFKRESAMKESIFRALEDLPVVRRRAEELGMSGPHQFLIRIGPVDTRKFSIDCEQCTLREVLNMVVSQSGGSWKYSEFTEGEKKTYSLR